MVDWRTATRLLVFIFVLLVVVGVAGWNLYGQPVSSLLPVVFRATPTRDPNEIAAVAIQPVANPVLFIPRDPVSLFVPTPTPQPVDPLACDSATDCERVRLEQRWREACYGQYPCTRQDI